MIETCNQVSPVETATRRFLIKADFLKKRSSSNIDFRLFTFTTFLFSGDILYIFRFYSITLSRFSSEL